MIDYSIRTVIDWPADVPALPPEREAELARWLEAEIKAEFDRLCNVPLPAPEPERMKCTCGAYAVLHRPNCPHWGLTT